MKPLPGNRAENISTGCISKSGRLARTNEQQGRKHLSQPLPGEVHLRAQALDIPTLLKTAQALSSEVRLEELLKKFLRFVLEHADAEKAVLLLEEQGRWAIGAIGRPDHIETYWGQPQHLEDTEEAPAEVIHDVERTREAIVLADAINQGSFTKAPYIIRHQCKSIFSLPLLNQGRLNSVLYLENSQIPGAFTEDRVKLLRWLSSQMAISIDNARLYQQLEQKIEERTRALKEEIAERKWIEQALRESIELAEAAQHEAEIAERREEKRRHEVERRSQIAESLRDIVLILNSNHPLDEVLDYIVSKAGSMLGSQAAAVYCASGKNGEVIVQAAQGLSGDRLSNAMRFIAQHNLEQTLLTPRLVTIPDIAAIDGSQDDSTQEIQGLLVLAPPVDTYRALLAAPILIKDEVYGRLRLYYRNPHAFSDEEAELAIMFSDQMALAIETARLREQAKQAAVIDERNRLARDLHDSVTQTIFSANLIAETLPRIWESHPEEGRCGLHELHHLIQGALAEMRTLLLELRPAAIVEKKLGELLKQLTQTTASQARATIALTVEGDRPLPAEVQIAFYRIAQETLNNIIKHARASHIVVKLYLNLESVVLSMSDNGCGFDPSAIPPDHLGMSIMRERAVSIGATFTLTSQPGHGAEVQITWRESTGGQAHD